MRVDARLCLALVASLLVGGCSLVVDFDRSLLVDAGPSDAGGGGQGGFAAGGGMSSTGWPHQPPCAPPSYLTHDCAGIYAATMAVAARWVRHRHGARVDYEVAYEEAATAARDRHVG